MEVAETGISRAKLQSDNRRACLSHFLTKDSREEHVLTGESEAGHQV